MIFQRDIFVNILPIYDLPTEMKSRKEINKQNYGYGTNEKEILSKLSIPQLNTNYILPSTKKTTNDVVVVATPIRPTNT